MLFYSVKYWRGDNLETGRGLIVNDTIGVIDTLQSMFGIIDLGSIEEIVLKPVGKHIDENEIFDLFD